MIFEAAPIEIELQNIQKATSSDYWSLVSNQYPSGKFPKVSIGITIPRAGSLSRGRDATTTPPLLTAFIPNWWIWGYWISPLMYGYNALAVNEIIYAPRWMNKFVME